jgi:hypothetical protein
MKRPGLEKRSVGRSDAETTVTIDESNFEKVQKPERERERERVEEGGREKRRERSREREGELARNERIKGRVSINIIHNFPESCLRLPLLLLGRPQFCV